MKSTSTKTASKHSKPRPTQSTEDAQVVQPKKTGTPTFATAPKIDKLIAALLEKHVPEDFDEMLAHNMKRLIRDSPVDSDGKRQFFKGSTKREMFKRILIQRLPSGAVIKYAIEPNKSNVKQRLQITLNPGHMTAKDGKRFSRTLRKLLGLHFSRLIHAFVCTRVDVCIDVLDVDLNRLLILFDGARSQGTFYVHIGRGGKARTYYLGSSQSATHGVVYEQMSSEKFKELVGEKTLKRVSVADDAEVAMTPVDDRIRIEVRNVLKPGLKLLELVKMPTAFDKFHIYELSEAAELKLSAADLAMLDVVRLRGHAGARDHLRRARRGATDAVNRLEDILARHAASWWKPSELAQCLVQALKATPVWTTLTDTEGLP